MGTFTAPAIRLCIRRAHGTRQRAARLATSKAPGCNAADISNIYDTEGRMTSVQYPGSTTGGTTTAAPHLGTAYETMGRQLTVTDLATTLAISSGTTYGLANELKSVRDRGRPIVSYAVPR